MKLLQPILQNWPSSKVNKLYGQHLFHHIDSNLGLNTHSQAKVKEVSYPLSCWNFNV